MASGKTVGGLYLSLGLDISELEAGFALADRTISDAIKQFRQESKNLTLQADIDTANAESSLDKLRIKYETLGKQIELSRKQEQLFLRDYEASLKAFGADSKITRNAYTDLLKQQRVTATMSEKYRDLKTALDASSSSMLRFGDATMAARGGVMGLANYVAMLVPELAAAAAILTAGLGLASLTKEAADAAASIGDLGDQLSIGTEAAAELQGTLKAAGVGTDTFVNFITRLDKAVLSAGEAGNDTTRTLERFGVSLTDNQGRLLSYNEQLAKLAEAYQNAKAAGKVEDFFAGIGSRGGAAQLRDLLNKYESEYHGRGMRYYAESLKATDEAAMELTDRLKEMDEQLDALKLAFGAAFIPVAVEIIQPVVAALRDMKDWIDDNKESLFEFADAVKTTAKAMATVANPITAAAIDWYGGNKDHGGSGGRFGGKDIMREREQAEREAKAAADAELKAQRENAEAIANIWRKANGSKLENDLAAIDQRMKKELEAANLTEQAKARIQERYAAEKLVAIMKTAQEVERMDRELSDSIAKQTQGELENALRDIDRQAEATRKKYLDLYGAVSAKTDELIQRNADLQRQNAVQSRADKALTSEKKYWDIFMKAMNGQTMGFSGGFKMFDLTGNLDTRLKAAEEAIRAEMLKSRGIKDANVKTSDLQMFDALMKRVSSGGLANITDDAGIMGDKVASAVSTSLQGVTEQMTAGMNAGLAPALDKLTMQDSQYQSAALTQYQEIRQAIESLKEAKREAAPVTVNVNIEQAVTEDSASMTRLADTVADRINEVLVRYIGDARGGTNTY